LAERYERRSVLISSNLVFSKWDQIFKDPMTTMAAIDRLVHHAMILEFNGESVRAQKAQGREKARLTRRPEPLRFHSVFGAWRRQRLRSTEGDSPKRITWRTDDEMKNLTLSYWQIIIVARGKE
jgi:hypothetical protein